MAFALYSPEHGGYFTYWDVSIGDIIVNRANVGIGVKETVSKLSLNGGMWIRGKNNVASVNGF